MKKHRVITLLLSAVLTLSPGLGAMVYAEEGAAAKTTFSDISGHWAKNTIEEAVALGIVGGYPDGTFLPDNLIKREEFFTLVCNILTEKPDTTGTVIKFTDVEANGWYLSTIQLAVAGGMTSGYPDGTFGIGVMMSRQEAAQVASTIISPLDEEAEVTASITDLQDVDTIVAWSYDAISLMFAKGYMRGDTEGNFRPTTGITRAEAVQLLLTIHKNEAEIKAGGAATSTNSSGKTDTETETAASKEPERSLSGCVTSHLARSVSNLNDVTDEEYAALPDGHFKVGDGTAAAPYEVYSQAQLDHLREHNQAGVYFKLMANIEVSEDFSGKKPGTTTAAADWTAGNWIPLGTKEDPFKGLIDGNGYIISGLKVAANAEGLSALNLKSDATGFIGYLAEEGRVTNLHISKCTFTNTGNYTGAVAGYAEGVITGCITASSVEINGANYVGGIAGYSRNGITECSNSGDVNGTGRYVGGVVGQFSSQGATLKGNHNRGTVNSSDTAGGIAGGVIGDELVTASTVVDCINYGEVNGGSYYTGGIVGIATGTNFGFTIENCENQGAVSGNSVAGGIVGFVESNKVSVTTSHNSGTVYGYSAGGIAGSNEGSIDRSYNEGKIDGAIYVGGIAGFQREDKAKVAICYNEGIIGSSNATNVGGIVGDNGAVVNNCYSTGSILASGIAGGITGKNSGRLWNVYSTGDIRDVTETGGVTGRNTGTITNCFWLEDTASAAVSGSANTGTSARVYGVSEEQLSGEKTVRTNSGAEDLLTAMNEYNSTNAALIWQYIKGSYTFPVLIDLQP